MTLQSSRRLLGFALSSLVIAALSALPAQAQFQVRTADPTASTPSALQSIDDINEAEQVLLPANGATISAFSSAPVINYVGTGGGGDFGTDSAFPNGLSGTDDFALEAIARLTFNTAGSYVFRVGSDDGFRLRTGVAADGTGGTVYSEFAGQRGPGNTDGAALVQAIGGIADIRLTYFERGGGEEVELSYSRDGGAFQLVGSTADITVRSIPGAVVPEAGTITLIGAAGLPLLGIALRRRRR